MKFFKSSKPKKQKSLANGGVLFVDGPFRLDEQPFAGSQVVIVLLTEDDCDTCFRLKKFYYQLSQDQRFQEAKFMASNTSQANKDQMKIKLAPTLLAFQSGVEKGRLVSRNEKEIRFFIRAMITTGLVPQPDKDYPVVDVVAEALKQKEEPKQEETPKVNESSKSSESSSESSQSSRSIPKSRFMKFFKSFKPKKQKSFAIGDIPFVDGPFRLDKQPFAGSQVVIVLFAEDDCSECFRMKEIYHQFSLDPRFKEAKFIVSNASQANEDQMKIKLAPTLLAFQNGVEKGRLVSGDVQEIEYFLWAMI